MDILFKPFRVATSKPAQRAYLTTFLLGSGSLFLLFTAVCAYTAFYVNYVPHIGVAKPIYLQYGPVQTHSSYPTGTVHFDGEIIPHQAYDVTLRLRLPTSPSNLAVGNFMTDLTIYATAPTASSSPIIVAHARRPSIMTYRTPLLTTLTTLFTSPLLVLGITQQEETLLVPLLQNTHFDASARHAVVRLESKLDVYDATVIFCARLTGVRWLMYRYRFAMFFVAPMLFWAVECCAMAVVWWVVYTYFSAGADERVEGGGGGGGEEELEEVGGHGYDVGILTPESGASATFGVLPEDMYADDEGEDGDGDGDEGGDEGEDGEAGGEILLRSDVVGDSGIGSSLSEGTARAREAAAGSRRRKRGGGVAHG